MPAPQEKIVRRRGKQYKRELKSLLAGTELTSQNDMSEREQLHRKIPMNCSWFP
jgi:hypothetical protein